jgi:hypothetical protein
LRDFTGINYQALPEPGKPEFNSRLKGLFADLDYFLRDVSFGVSRLDKGQTTLGVPITTVVDLTNYFFLPGRAGGQTAYGGVSISDNLVLSPNKASTTLATLADSGLTFNSDITLSNSAGGYLSSASLGALRPYVQICGSTCAVTNGFGGDDTLAIESGTAQTQTVSITSITTPTPTWPFLNCISNAGGVTNPVFGILADGSPQITLNRGSGKVLVSDANGKGTWTAFSGVTASFDDSLFSIFNHASPTKLIAFSAASITAGNTRTLTAQDASGTLAYTSALLDGVNRTDSTAGTVARGDVITGQGASAKWTRLAKGAANQSLVMDGTATDIAWATRPMLTTAQTWTGAQTFDNSALGTNPTILTPNSGGDVFLTIADVAAPGTNVTNFTSPVLVGVNTLAFPTSGTVVTTTATQSLTNKAIQSGTVTLTAQGADITTTNITITPSNTGVYKVEVVLMCTTADATAGTLSVTIGWTDLVGATSRAITADPGATGFPFTLATTGRTSGEITLRRASGNITYATAITGIYGAAKYALAVRVLALG